jgi:putative endonuclease
MPLCGKLKSGYIIGELAGCVNISEYFASVMRDHNYWVYVLTNKHRTTLYIGMTSDLQVRLGQHRSGEMEGFTKRYHLNRLVWFEHFGDVNDAIACEKRLKGRLRRRKIELVEKTNPRWLDLSADWDEQTRPNDWRWDTEGMIRD